MNNTPLKKGSEASELLKVMLTNRPGIQNEYMLTVDTKAAPTAVQFLMSAEAREKGFCLFDGPDGKPKVIETINNK